MRNGPRGSYKDSANMHCKEMDAALAANPPEIVWVKDRNGIMRAVQVDDPHTTDRKRGRAKKQPAPKPLTAAAYKAQLAAHVLELEARTAI
jgi:hypothetical protein